MAIASTIMGATAEEETTAQPPPRPKTLRMYNFGSPRVGNPAFAERFGRLIEAGRIDEAYRIVNAQDVVARVPRPMLNIDYEHCGRTVLIEEPAVVLVDNSEDGSSNGAATTASLDEVLPEIMTGSVLWIEGESDFPRFDPVRDYRNATRSPIAEGSLLNELYSAYQQAQTSPRSQDASAIKVSPPTMQGTEAMSTNRDSCDDDDDDSEEESFATTETNVVDIQDETGMKLPSNKQLLEQLGAVASRLSKTSMADLTSVFGIDRAYATREIRIAQSLFSGQALAHHLEDSYYAAMGRAVGFVAKAGEDIVPLSSEKFLGSPLSPEAELGSADSTTS